MQTNLTNHINCTTEEFKDIILNFMKSMQIVISDTDSNLEDEREYLLHNLALIRTYLDCI